MFSIIIPVYNKEKYIKRTLNSVLDQSFTDFEVIIVDDGSTDKSMEIVSEFNDHRIKVVFQKNSGVSAARNKGIEVAVHEYISFIDADDMWQNMFLEKVADLIKKYPEAGAYYTSYKVVKNEAEIGLINQNIIEEQLLEDYFEFAIKEQPIWTASVVIKNDVFKKIGNFPTQYKIGEDIYIWSKLALNYTIAHTSYIGAIYFKDVPSGLTDLKVNKVLLAESFANDAEDFFRKYIDKAENGSTFREYMIRTIVDKPKFLMKQNKKKEAREILRRYSNTRYYKSKVMILYILSYFPSSFISKVLGW